MPAFSASNSVDTYGSQLITGGLTVGSTTEQDYGIKLVPSLASVAAGTSLTISAQNLSFIAGLTVSTATSSITSAITTGLTVTAIHTNSIQPMSVSSAVGNITLSNAASLNIDGVPTLAGTTANFATFSNAYGLKIAASSTIAATAYGAYIDVPTGTGTRWSLYIASGNSYFNGSLSVMGNQGISGDMVVAGLSTMGSATMSSATMTSASITTITGNTTHSGTLSGNTLTGNKITQPNLPFVVNDISRYFDGNKASFPLRKEQSALTSLVTSSGTISSIVSSATQFVVTHSLGTIVPGSYITISGCSTAGYNNTWLVRASTSTACTVITPVNLTNAPSTPGTFSGSLTSIVDSKDVEVILNGQYLDPYVTELRYPWITEWDANGGFKVSGSNLILYNAPVSGDKATVKVTGISQSVQTRRYPFSSATIALGD